MNDYKLLREDSDSDEEVYFIWWLNELKENGYIESWSRGRTFELSQSIKREYSRKLKTKIKRDTEHFLHAAKYTPDFEIKWRGKAIGKFVTKWDSGSKKNTVFYCNENLITIVEVKGGFDHQNMTRLVQTKIKWLFQLYQIPVQIVKIPKFFEKTFTPNRYLTTNLSQKKRTIKFDIKGIERYKGK